MSWNSGGQNPWGLPDGGHRRRPGKSGGPSNGGPPMPDFDGLIGKVQDFIRSMLGSGGSRGGRRLSMLALGTIALWMASGFYRVQPDEQGVVLRFGAYSYWTPPGLHWHLPWPIERVETPSVTRVNRTEIGYRSAQSTRAETARDPGVRDVLAESLMLTGDENIIDIDVAVFWRINNAAIFLFNTRSPEALARGVAESSMREVIGRTPIQPALTQLRAQIETDVFRQTQQILDRYQVGVEITQVQLQKVDPPAAVIESFRDVQRANTDAERLRNEAEGYRNDIVPRARGDAARLTAQAEGAKLASVSQATGQGQRFDSLLAAYRQAKDVTVRRMYLDTMQAILSRTPTMVVDDRMKGLVPFLPLNLPNQPPSSGAPSQGQAEAQGQAIGASR
jgi:membrane protease subunit HflK